MTLVKICGLRTPADAEAAIALGADMLGFVLERSSPRFVGDDHTWIGELQTSAMRVAVFGKVDRTVGPGIFDAVQGADWLVDDVPAHRRFHSIRVRPGEGASDLIARMSAASAIVLDAYRPEAYGGTGHTIDWSVAREFVGISKTPVILAGGLTPENVEQAILQVGPYAVDVSSGLESKPGVKDLAKMRDFVQAVRKAS